jgi:DNA polymerase-3 subunit gamma/tau
VDVFEIDGASNTGVEDIRELRENIKYLPSRCRFKIFIIDEVHMLSTSAFNALLKTLEEPPPHVKFIFATTEPHKVPVTILSRCQRFDFKRIPLPGIVNRLRFIVQEENVTISDASLTAIARKGDGSMRDSLSTLDQVLAFCGDSAGDEEVTALLGVVDRRLLAETSRTVFAGDCRGALEIVSRVDSCGYNMRSFCQELIEHFRNLAVLKVTRDHSELLDVTEGEIEEIRTQTASLQLEQIRRHLTILLKAETEMSQSGYTRLILELALLKMCTLPPVVPVDEIMERLQYLERGTKNAQYSPSPPEGIRPATPYREKDTGRKATPGAAPAPETTPPQVDKGWPGFVTFVTREKKTLGAHLEHGRPMRFSADSVEIGFPEGSFHLACLQDDEALKSLTEIASRYWKAAPSVRVVALTGDTKGAPPSIKEKKKRETVDRQREIEESARKNTLVSAALEIFGGEIGEVVEIRRHSDTKEDKH